MTQVMTKEVTVLIEEAKAAQQKYESFNQEQVDKIVDAVAAEMTAITKELAQMAFEETGFGKVEDKITKNLFASEAIYSSIKDERTVGIIHHDEAEGIYEIAVPMGVVAALIPMTNPTSTVIFKALLSLKTRNAIVFSPHPAAVKSIVETARRIEEVAVKAGAPAGLIQVIEQPSLEETERMMQHEDTAIILATGGSQMVKAAYSSGNPAIGVGAGNGPAFIEKTANIAQAVEHILASKLFDYGVICTSEESIIAEAAVKDEVVKTLLEKGAYFLNDEQVEKLSKIAIRENGTLNPAIVGKPVSVIAKLAGIDVPESATILIVAQTIISEDNPYSREMLAPILPLYIANNWEDGVEKVSQLLNIEGIGHTAILHSTDKAKVEAFGLSINASRILVNTGGTLGGIGATTMLNPSLTLGCGTAGGSSTTDNISAKHLLNIRRVAMHYDR
ncbi:aldehyde dehydrogenase family protein [Sporosarcina sp. G11-34]|uniref:aldehyde dehydrogenase family protein n=1 Tax=Sporosarcina sp. G11-34 TaxID=2849605 RepID=UPI0022A9D373|nr:aldehyde dehydrogenase family protein [Sporosarcina sp. G11-34]MCZ2258668.1 aldehyde dehydrogenase family protein [Sporosarcina sp. G11-34]